MEKTTFVMVNGRKYSFTCRSYKEGNTIVNECDLQNDDGILSVGRVKFFGKPLYQSYDFSIVIASSVRLCHDTMYFKFRKENNVKRWTSKKQREFNDIPLIKDMNELWYNRLKTSVWE